MASGVFCLGCYYLSLASVIFKKRAMQWLVALEYILPDILQVNLLISLYFVKI